MRRMVGLRAASIAVPMLIALGLTVAILITGKLKGVGRHRDLEYVGLAFSTCLGVAVLPLLFCARRFRAWQTTFAWGCGMSLGFWLAMSLTPLWGWGRWEHVFDNLPHAFWIIPGCGVAATLIWFVALGAWRVLLGPE